MKQGIRKDGDFCWFNMITPQPKEAMAFFGEVLGWTFFDMGGIGHGIRVGESQVGGLFDKDAPQTPPGTKAHIGVMVKVRDVDATVEKVKALGGEARPAFDIFDAGRMAVCFDPNGAAFDPWQPKNLKGFDVNSNAHGAPSWFESLTTDPARAEVFYAKLFNWQSEVMKTPDGDYTTFKLGNDFIAGIMKIPQGVPIDKPTWHTYFTVDKVDETEALAKKLGAQVCVPSTDIPGVGRFCGIVSPQHVRFNVITYVPMGG